MNAGWVASHRWQQAHIAEAVFDQQYLTMFPRVPGEPTFRLAQVFILATVPAGPNRSDIKKEFA